MTFLLCDLCVLLRPVHFWLWLGRPGKSVVPFPALVPMAEPFRFTSGVSVSPREGTRLTETGPKARILQARRPPRAFFNGLLTELERLFGRGSTKRPSLTGLNGGGHRPPLQAFCRGFRLYWKEEERPARAPAATCEAHVLVCLAGGVNYRDERNPTGAMTPTVVEG